MAKGSVCMERVRSFECELGGRCLKFEFGQVAKQANGAVVVTYGDTTVLVTATMSKEPRKEWTFPLTVDVEERLYAVGRIPLDEERRQAS